MRYFATINHPEPDEEGNMKYSLYEVITETGGAKRYLLIDSDMYQEDAQAYIGRNGAYDV